jgi:hypothetical protein
MTDIQKKLEDYLEERESDDFYPEEDVSLMDRMMDFIMELNIDNLSEEQSDEFFDIVDNLADSNLDEMFELDEAISAKKVKISPQAKRERHREYRKKRAALKLKAKKFRKTAKYKQYMRAKKRKMRQGKTARGKRIRKFL